MNNAVLNAGQINGRLPPGRKTGQRRLSGDFIALMTGGEAYFCKHSEAKQLIKAPVLIYVPDGMPHRYDPNPQQHWKNYWMLFDGKIAIRSFGSILPPCPGVFKIKETDDIEKDWSDLCAVKLSECPDADAYSFLLLHKILFGVLMRIRGTVLSHRPSRFDFMLQELSKKANAPDLDLHVLAKNHGFSYDNFRKQFKAQTGMSPWQYFLKLKINNAKTLLLNSTLNIKQIAEMIGFENQYYFSRIFKEKAGMSPTEFRYNLLGKA
ncbi:MAG: hypothetical protein A2020_08045 [Lentisphaerae bacterium GWF2_45_14]|nr:MAG: hypothetical protein A2020_08045 [Lentisphaerae bacterium GWF2_45_14]